MKINVANFCSLSRASDFQDWLKSVALDLHTELIEHLKLGKSCGSNKNKMHMIYDKLKQVNLHEALVTFLKRTHPNMLMPEAPGAIAISAETAIAPIEVTAEIANVHGVFPSYKPGLLMLPQHGIFMAHDYESVMNKIVNFLRNKISTDYIVLKSNLYWHGYVEYFDRKFILEVDKIKRENRPIAKYKLKNGIK